MKTLTRLTLFFCLGLPLAVQAQIGPPSRVYFHAKIDETQKQITAVYGVEGKVRQAATAKTDSLQAAIEADSGLDNNAKIKFLRGLNDALAAYLDNVKSNASDANLSILPGLVEVFGRCIDPEKDSLSIYSIVTPYPYATRQLITGNFAFADNPGLDSLRADLASQYLLANPKKILDALIKNPDMPGADTLIAFLARFDPETVYTYSQSTDRLGERMRNSKDALVKIICHLGQMPTGRQFFPFLDDLYHNKLTFDQVDSCLNDSVKYYHLLVQTAVGYANRMMLRDTPLAMADLMSRMSFKAKEVYVNTINELHDAPDETRFKIIDKLSPEELYYLPILSEEEIYTSSYVRGVYPRLFKKQERSDSLLMRLRFDHFRKWIKIAANFDELDDFLKKMDKGNAELLMKAFVNGLDKSGSLEDAVDVANSFGSINDTTVRRLILNQVQYNLQKAKADINIRATNIYNILNILFLSMDSTNHVDVSKLLGIPPVFYMPLADLKDTAGKVVVEQFFYGDKDGNEGYSQFRSDFSNSNWKITDSAKWIMVSSTRGTKVVIYANKPLDEKKGLDAIARQAMIDYLDSLDITPTILIHRGHSYYLGETLEKLQGTEKIVLLGSCGGYQSLKKVLGKCPVAHIVASKQTGSKTVNGPLIVAAMDMLRQGKDLNWLTLWQNLSKEGLNKELFDDYIPPYKNLGALFIMAYNRMVYGGQ